MVTKFGSARVKEENPLAELVVHSKYDAVFTRRDI